MNVNSLVDLCYDYTKELVHKIDDESETAQGFAANYICPRVHYVAVAALEVLGTALGLISCAVLLSAAVIGETLYLPVRVWDATQYVSESLRNLYQAQLPLTLCKTARFITGALSSIVIGSLVHPETNTEFHRTWIVV